VKLLFDQNLAPRLVALLKDLYPDSLHVREVGLQAAADEEIWDAARKEGCVVVSKDADFRQKAFLRGHPPKVIWIRLGNCSTDSIAKLLWSRHAEVSRFLKDPESAFLALG